MQKPHIATNECSHLLLEYVRYTAEVCAVQVLKQVPSTEMQFIEEATTAAGGEGAGAGSMA